MRMIDAAGSTDWLGRWDCHNPKCKAVWELDETDTRPRRVIDRMIGADYFEMKCPSCGLKQHKNVRRGSNDRR